MSTRDLIEGEALLDDDENEEEFDEETGEPIRGPSIGEPNTYDDSSEEDDEEEEDEEAARAVMASMFRLCRSVAR
jgi:transcription elongation factor SPT6